MLNWWCIDWWNCALRLVGAIARQNTTASNFGVVSSCTQSIMAAEANSQSSFFCHQCQRRSQLVRISPMMASSLSCRRCGAIVPEGQSQAQLEGSPVVPGLAMASLSQLFRGSRLLPADQVVANQHAGMALSDEAFEELLERLLLSTDLPDRPASKKFINSLPKVKLKPAHFCRLKLCVDGFPESILPTEARFGPSLVQIHCDHLTRAAAEKSEFELTPQLQLMEHYRGVVTAANPLEGHADPDCILSPGEWSGRMVLMRRGTITFARKARLVQQFGGRILLVCQSESKWPFVMSDSAADAGLEVPAIMISQADAERLMSRLNSCLSAPLPPPLEPAAPLSPGEQKQQQLQQVQTTPQVTLVSEFYQISCCVCQCDLELGEEVTRLPCAHLYHLDCLTEWLGKRSNCPLCRQELPADENAPKPPPSAEQEQQMLAAAASVSMWG